LDDPVVENLFWLSDSLGFGNFKSQTENLEVISSDLMIHRHVSLLDLTVEIYSDSPDFRDFKSQIEKS
jgi:hypothetical protein